MTKKSSTSKVFGLTVKPYTSKQQSWFRVEGSTKKPSASLLKRILKIEVRESSPEIQEESHKDKYLLLFLKEGIATATLDFASCKKLQVGDLGDPSSLRMYQLNKVDTETGEVLKTITVYKCDALDDCEESED